jgi:ABC-type sugar transport system substrate-binding protein
MFIFRKKRSTKMKGKVRKSGVVTICAIIIGFLLGSSLNAEVMQIKPKGAKKITIGVMDLISAIEVAAIYNAAYKKEAESRGWELKVFDLQLNIPQTQAVMENMIAAGYDGIIVNWTSPHFYADQVKKAFDRGIPVVTVGEGITYPGVVAEVGQYYGVSGGLTAQYLATKLKGTGPKIVAFIDNRLEISKIKYAVAKAIFDYFKISVVTEIDLASAQGNPSVWSQEQMQNLLLADKKKEIKGVWAFWEGAGNPAAEACAKAGRDEVVVVTCEDSPRTYELIRTLPTLHAASGANGIFVRSSVKKLFGVFDEIFAGKPIGEGQLIEAIPYLVTKQNLPPGGYFLRCDGNYSESPDFAVK